MSWILAFVGFAVLVLLHEAGHFVAAKAVGMRVERFSLFFPPLIARKTFGETEYAIGAIPLGGYVKISGMNPDEDLPDEVRTRAYWAQPPWKRIVVIAAGPAVNLVVAFALFLLYFGVIGLPGVTTRVDSVQARYPAAGQIRPGDRLLAVDGRRGSPQVLADAISRHTCVPPPRPGCAAAEPAELLVRRGDGREVTLRLRPVYDAQLLRTRLGFGFTRTPREALPPAAAVALSTRQFWYVTKETVKLPLRLFDPVKRKEISSVVGGYEITRQTILIDAALTVQILALISLSFAIINMFPFLPLDGGHIFWAVVEKVRGKPVSYGLMERAGVLGFVLVMGLFFIGLSNDIGRLTGEGFGLPTR